MALENLIYTVARGDGMPDFLSLALVAQARHETGDFGSHAFIELNNLFGYSYNSKSAWQLPAPGFTADNNALLGQYATPEDSVHEMTHWILRRVADGRFPTDLSQITTLDQYAALLRNAGYYTDSLSNYLTGLKRWFVTGITSLQSGAGGLIIVAGLALLLFYGFSKRK